MTVEVDVAVPLKGRGSSVFIVSSNVVQHLARLKLQIVVLSCVVCQSNRPIRVLVMCDGEAVQLNSLMADP